MLTTYRLRAEELTDELVKKIRDSFKDKEIEITVQEVDETEYLLSSSINKERLLEAIRDVDAGKSILHIDSI
jgi:antitoxin YefM